MQSNGKGNTLGSLFLKLFVAFATISIVSCEGRNSRVHPTGVAAQIAIDSTLGTADSLEAFIRPYREHVNAVLDSALAFAPETLTKTDGPRNSSLGNLMADIVHTMADSLLRMQQKPEVDFVVLNHGGIRSVLSAGVVTERTAYQLMPFENTLFIAELNPDTITKMLQFLSTAGSPHPISGIKIALDPSGNIDRVLVADQPLDPDRTYRVATSSYLISGGDGMDFFERAVSVEDTGYKIRNALVDFFKATDTLYAQPDDRFTPNPLP